MSHPFGWTDGRRRGTASLHDADVSGCSSRRRAAAAAVRGRRPLFTGRLRVANQQSAAAKGNPLFSTPVIISIRCLAPSSLAMISTFKWRRGEGKTNVGFPAARAARTERREPTLKAGGTWPLQPVTQCAVAAPQLEKKKNYLSNHVESETRVSDRNTTRKPIKVAPTAGVHLRALYSHISKNKFPLPRRGLHRLRVTPAETKVTSESRHLNDPTLTRGAFKITLHGG